jgi:transcriptional antiterminator NusG
MIVKVDRRKGRARVRLEMYEDSFEVDFGFEALDSAAPPPSKD